MSSNKKNKCSCRGHHQFGSDDSQVFKIQSSKKLKKCAIDYLINEGQLEKFHKFICEDCYTHGLLNAERMSKEASIETMSFSTFCSRIEKNNITQDEFINVSRSYGKLLNIKFNSIYKETANEVMDNINLTSMWSTIDDGVKEFFNQLSKKPCDNNKLSICYSYEHLMNIANEKYIGPLNFYTNIISYFISGSRKIVEINNCFSPSGSYATVQEFLKNKANKEHGVPEGDGIYVFDNNQLMARSWRVQYNSKPLVSVVTTVACLIPPTKTYLQNCDEYLPIKWLSFEPILQPEELINETGSVFRGYRNVFICNNLKSLTTDDKCEQPPKRRKMEFKDDKLTPEKNLPADPYCGIDSFVSGQTTVTLLDPILVNPCSYISLQTVLETLVEKAKTKWIAVVCDGLPFNLCSKIIDNYYKCPHCDQVFTSTAEFHKHINTTNLNLNKEIIDCKLFPNVLLLPGFGHLDLNLTKALFKLLWKACLKDLVGILGWKSVKALAACENCTDHHKATQILEILHESLTKVLLNMFIQSCNRNGNDPSLENLFNFLNQQSELYIFLFKCNFTYIYAWKMFKKGMRRGNYTIMKASLNKLTTLIYGLNMTTYMDLWFRFECLILKAPDQLKNFVTSNICLSQSGHPSKAEGADFILESTNKKIKTYMPSGVPTNERWTRVCRNIVNIEKMQEAIHSNSSQEPPTSSNPYFRKFSDSQAVSAFEHALTMWISKEEHLTLDGQPLDSEVANFDQKCDENKALYYKNYPNVLRICERIFITEEDRRSFYNIQNKTKAEINTKIMETLKAWFNEKFAPELLEARTDLVDCMLEQMAQMEENIARAKRGDFKVSLHRMEIDRIRYIVTSYLRCRLHKIEQFTSHVLEEEQQRKDEDASKLSPDEFQFARDYAESLESHMSSLALRHMPQNLQSLNPAQTAPRPNLDKYVFLRVNEATEGVLVEEETLDTGEEIVDLEKEDQHIMRYKPLMSLVNSGVVSLI